MNDQQVFYRRDCAYFRGDVPCRQHKEYGVHCEDCEYYKALDEKILIIKLGAIGDVIRTSPLIEKIRKEHPKAAIWWLTYSPEVVPSGIEKILPFNTESILSIRATSFNKIINLDKDHHACSLASLADAEEKLGFLLKDGKPAPANKNAEHKFLTGIFDDVNKSNEKNYLEEIFEICGWKFQGEEYVIEYDEDIKWDIDTKGKPVIGLNTGCGARWVSRLWADDNWLDLISLLINNNMYPLLLGGSQEHERNLDLARRSGATYLGHFPLEKFISLVNQCNTVVSAVTMGMHIAIALKKPLVLLNNIFNRNEFELYGRGEILEPEKECKCFFSPECRNEEYFCMDHIRPKTVFEAVINNTVI